MRLQVCPRVLSYMYIVRSRLGIRSPSVTQQPESHATQEALYALTSSRSCVSVPRNVSEEAREKTRLATRDFLPFRIVPEATQRSSEQRNKRIKITSRALVFSALILQTNAELQIFFFLSERSEEVLFHVYCKITRYFRLSFLRREI